MSEPTGRVTRLWRARLGPVPVVPVALGLLAVVAMFVAWRTTAAMGQDEGFCTSRCHTEFVASKDDKPHHAGVSCQGCHAQGSGMKLWWAQKTGGAPPSHGKIVDDDCTRCHNEIDDAQWRLTVATDGHRTHQAAGDKMPKCVDCHAAEQHKGEPPSRTCTGCHEGVELHQVARDEAATGERCVACHAFTADDSDRPAAVTACGKCHNEPQTKADGQQTQAVTPTSLHGKVGCKLCHSPHEDKEAKLRASKECSSCHRTKAQETGPEGHKRCQGCHQPHAAEGEAVAKCYTCHEFAAPGGSGANTTALKHKGCDACHKPHTWVANKAACGGCHETKAASLANRGEKDHGRCTNCHEPHQPLPGPSTCVGCHSDKSGHIASANRGHASCSGCHSVHTGGRAMCQSCHSNQGAQVASSPAAPHRKSCLGCHQNHGSPQASPAVCGRCHGDKAAAVKAAGPAPHKVCASCHVPHTFAAAGMKATCSRCHSAVAGAVGSHKGDCKSCHQPHGPPGVPPSACAKCHTKVDPTAMAKTKHANCRSCHQPHVSKASASAQCQGCHSDKAAIAKSWPAGSAHQGNCAGCHQPHNVRAQAGCGTCHSTQATQAKGGKHGCTNCHSPHQAPGGWWNRCSGCHSGQAAAAKARGGTHGQCSNCHKQHGFSKPSCASCHSAMKGKAAHGIGAHQSCTACHASHAKNAMGGRDQCTRCHEDKKNHNPKSKLCTACHPFK